MNATLDFPEIVDPPATAPAQSRTAVAIAASGKVDLAKLDLADVAIAKFGDWRGDVARTTETLTGVVHDLSTQAKIDDAKSLRHRLINTPLAEKRKVSAALKSKLTTVSKEVGEELTLIEAAYKGAAQLITPQIEAREAVLEAERMERARVEDERQAKHRTNLDTLAGYVDHAKGLPSERIAAGIAKVKAIVVDRDAWEEFADRAEEQKAVTIERLQAMFVETQRLEHQAQENERLRLESEATARLTAAMADLSRLVGQALDFTAEELAATIAALKAGPYAAEDVAPAIAAALESSLDQLSRLHAAAVQRESTATLLAKLQADQAAAAAAAAPAPAPLQEEPAAEVQTGSPADDSAPAAESATAAPAPASSVVPTAEYFRTSAAPAAAPVASETDVRTVTTGQLNEALGYAVTAGYITNLGFTAIAIPRKAGSHWRAIDIEAICAAIAAATIKVGKAGL